MIEWDNLTWLRVDVKETVGALADTHHPSNKEQNVHLQVGGCCASLCVFVFIPVTPTRVALYFSC